MMDRTKQTVSEQLEAMIDAHGLAVVVDALSSVCFEKAQHIEGNWQDSVTAKRWDRVATKIDKLAGDAGAVS